MADQTLASFVIKLRHDIDPASAKRFADSIGEGIRGVNDLRLKLVALAVGAEEAIRRTTNSFSNLYYLSRSTGVAAAGIESLRAKFVAAGMDARAADAAISGLARGLRDPGTVLAVQNLLGRPIANAKDGIDGLARAYANALKLSHGREWEGPAYALRLQLEAIDGIDFEAVRALGLNFEQGEASAAKLLATLNKIKFVGSLDEANKRAAEMENTFYRLGKTFQYVFAEAILNPKISETIELIAEKLGEWLVSEETQKSIEGILDAIGDFVKNPQNLNDAAQGLKNIGSGLLAIVDAGKWLIQNSGALADTLNKIAGVDPNARKMDKTGRQPGEPGYSPTEGGEDDWLGSKSWARLARAINRFLGNPEEAGWTSPEAHQRMRQGYQHGGIVPANLHAGEMVLPADLSAGFQRMFRGGGGTSPPNLLESNLNDLAQSFDRWWAGDSAFRPIINFAAEIYERLRQLLEEFFKPLDETSGGGGGAGEGAGAAAGGGGPPAPGGSAGGGRMPGPPGGAGRVKPGGKFVTMAQMVQLALDAGFSKEEAPIMAAIAMHESGGGNPYAEGKAGEQGITQINPHAWGELAAQARGNPKRAMEIAKMISDKARARGLDPFHDWSSYTHGYYRQYLEEARRVKPEPYNPEMVGGATGGPSEPTAEQRRMDPMAPAGSPVSGNTTVVTSPSGRKFRIAAEFAENFRGFITEYENQGGIIGPYSGGLGERPDNASYHPQGRAIDVNQWARGKRRGGRNLPPEQEDALALRWGLYPGSKFNDIGHFEVRNAAEARRALERIRAEKAARPTTSPGAMGVDPNTGEPDPNVSPNAKWKRAAAVAKNAVDRIAAATTAHSAISDSVAMVTALAAGVHGGHLDYGQTTQTAQRARRGAHTTYVDNSRTTVNAHATDPHGTARVVADMRDRHSARFIRNTARGYVA